MQSGGRNKQIPICDTGREGAGQAGHDMAGRSPKIKGQERGSAICNCTWGGTSESSLP